jgi:hypothetical protein
LPDVRFFGYDPDDHLDEQHDTDDYEDEDPRYIRETPRHVTVKVSLTAVKKYLVAKLKAPEPVVPCASLDSFPHGA